MAPAIFRPIARAVNKAIEMCCVSCPTGSTTDENGIISRFDITICFCDTPDDRSENPYESGVTITVNGTPWTVDSAQPKAGTDCVTFTGLEPLSYGDVILFNFDYSASTWVSPTEDIVNLVITNYIGAPVQLLNLPSFNAVTGRLDPGDFYNTRTTSTTFINSDSYVEGITNNKLIYDGARIVQNLAAATATPATQNITVVSGRKYLVSIGAGSAVGATAVCSNAFTGTLTGDGANRITFNSGTAKTAGSTTLTVTITGAIADLQVEDVTAKAVQDAPGEYESVGVGIGDVLTDNALFVPKAWLSYDEGLDTYTLTGPSGVENIEYNYGTIPGIVPHTDLVVYEFSLNISSGGVRPKFGTAYGDWLYPASNGSIKKIVVTSAVTSGIIGFQCLTGTTGTIQGLTIKEATTGYGIYNRANGNTVDANGVVTDTPGALLATAPVLRHAPAATNSMWPSTPNSTNWTVRGSTTLANVDEGNTLGQTCQVRGLGASGIDDFYRTLGTVFSADAIIELSFWMKAITTTGTFFVKNAYSSTIGNWTIDVSKVSTTQFERITRDHDAVTITTEFSADASGQAGLLFNRGTGTSYDFDILGVQLETGRVSTPSIKTTTASASRTIDQILHPYSASVFDVDEGTVFVKFKLNIDSDDKTGAHGYFILDDVYGGNGRVLHTGGAGSYIYSHDGVTSDRDWGNTTVGNSTIVCTRFSKSANIKIAGAKGDLGWQWDLTPATHSGFTATDLMSLMVALGTVATIEAVIVLDSYLTEADAEDYGDAL